MDSGVHQAQIALPDRFQHIVIAAALRGKQTVTILKITHDRAEAVALVGDPAGKEPRGEPTLYREVMGREHGGRPSRRRERLVDPMNERAFPGAPRLDSRGDGFER